MKYVCIHGHFYQPDRTNPATGRLEPEPSAAPFSNWNDRIFSECYGVNASTPMVDGAHNNYHHLNTDFGPTLLRWMEQEKPRTYEAIIASNKAGAGQRYDTGNVMAQGYHHAILPLLNQRDLETEILWGIRDFEHRFQCTPEGFWLPETAVNTEVLKTLVQLGIQYVVLSPRQAKSISPPQGDALSAQSVSDLELSQRPYLVQTPSGPITVFFYHGSLAQSVAFGGVLNDGEAFAHHLAHQAQSLEANALVHFATDGESYGHHHAGGNLALSHLIETLHSHDDIKLTSYSAYLQEHPATWTAEIVENSSWSCAHGIERWRSNCGCNTGGPQGWTQLWRKPLRDLLDTVRDEIIPAFENQGSKLFQNPWQARNNYITLMLRPSTQNYDAFEKQHRKSKAWTRQERALALNLLEIQRRLLNMYTSCGWFFDEVSGIEPLQNIRHALEAVRLADQHMHSNLESSFQKKCYQLPSNDVTHFHQQLDKIFSPSRLKEAPKNSPRKAGILLHISSLPSPHGIGDLGQEARHFVDWMVKAGATAWQFLPLGPTDAHGSCYSSWSSLSGNPWLIDLRNLESHGLLQPEEIQQMESADADPVDFRRIGSLKEELLERAAERFLQDSGHDLREAWKRFQIDAAWARDAGLFRYLKKKHDDKPWWEWSTADRNPSMARLNKHFKEGQTAIDRWMVQEFFFETQMSALRQYAEARGIELIGDIAMYVAGDSVDVWRHQNLFQLDKNGHPNAVAGAPPDAFNEEGQRWGNPIYNCDAMKRSHYSFWKNRFRRALDHADKVRFDHFRGLAAYWEIPAHHETAKEGHWVPGPGRELFEVLIDTFGELPMVVEDLGDIDQDVYDLRDAFGFPGMAVLQFGFEDHRTNEHTPCNIHQNAWAYTGTHDCNTTVGWWREQSPDVQDRVRRYCSSDGNDIAWDVIRMTMASVARCAEIPMQDVLALGAEARMNTPGTLENNWSWRLSSEQLSRADHRRFYEMVELFGRNHRA